MNLLTGASLLALAKSIYYSERDSGREGSKEAHKYGKKRLVLINGYVFILVSYSVLMCSCLNLYFCLKKNTKLQLKIVLP